MFLPTFKYGTTISLASSVNKISHGLTFGRNYSVADASVLSALLACCQTKTFEFYNLAADSGVITPHALG